MSRRKSKGPDKMLSIVCTGRGAHARQVAAKAAYFGLNDSVQEIEIRRESGSTERTKFEWSGGVILDAEGNEIRHPVAHPEKIEFSLVGGEGGRTGSYEFCCPTCGRNLRLSLENTEKLLRNLADSGGLDFDISMV